MSSESKAINRLINVRSEVSCHYFIKRNGSIILMVPEAYEAWHAGKSNWKKIKSLNKYSIGIEINNPGHDHGYKIFSSKQVTSLIKLLRYLKKKYNIKKQNILGHSDISPDRKKDPGEKFPWSKLAKKNLCSWHNLKEKNIKKFRNLKIRNNQYKLFFKNLEKIGYLNINGSSSYKRVYLIKAFQRKFRQSLVNGKIDQECLLISKSIQ